MEVDLPMFAISRPVKVVYSTDDKPTAYDVARKLENSKPRRSERERYAT